MEEYHDEVEAQPTGVRLEKTLAVVNEILTNPEICERVKEKHGWPVDMASDRVALLFLTARYQDTVTVLSLQTQTLKRFVDSHESRIVALEDRVFADARR